MRRAQRSAACGTPPMSFCSAMVGVLHRTRVLAFRDGVLALVQMCTVSPGTAQLMRHTAAEARSRNRARRLARLRHGFLPATELRRRDGGGRTRESCRAARHRRRRVAYLARARGGRGGAGGVDYLRSHPLALASPWLGGLPFQPPSTVGNWTYLEARGS